MPKIENKALERSDVLILLDYGSLARDYSTLVT
jgi:hypothetical protein